MRQTGWMWALPGVALVLLVAALTRSVINHRLNPPDLVPLAPAIDSSGRRR